tara:strand:+ start:802 stop:999 length:198 start_codon:yes stop_codon:yes gene_type:complete
MIHKTAAAFCTLLVYACAWSTIWLHNRYWYESAPVETAEVALLVGLFAVFYSAKTVMDLNKEREE